MEFVNLYRRTGHLSNRYAKFPENYEVVGQVKVDDGISSIPDVASRRWSVLEREGLAVKYARAYDRIDGKYKGVLLHRLIWSHVNGPIDVNLVIDHINYDGLDNRIENLRLVTRAENNRHVRVRSNSLSKYIGVDTYKHRALNGSYNAYVCPGSKKKTLGHYPTIQEAAFARNIAALILYNGFAVPNVVSEEEVPHWRRDEIREKVEAQLRRHGLLSEAI